MIERERVEVPAFRWTRPDKRWWEFWKDSTPVFSNPYEDAERQIEGLKSKGFKMSGQALHQGKFYILFERNTGQHPTDEPY